jgi:hypothetical protein
MHRTALAVLFASSRKNIKVDKPSIGLYAVVCIKKHIYYERGLVR